MKLTTKILSVAVVMVGLLGFSPKALASAPTVVTGSVSNVSSSSVTLNGSVNPNGLATDYWFEYGIGNFNDLTSMVSIGSGTASLSQSKTVNGLTAGTTYVYHIVARNSQGTHYGLDKTFTTSSVPSTPATSAPEAVTGSASGISQTSATLSGSVDPNGLSTDYWFEYGINNFDNLTSTASVGSGTSSVSVPSRTISGLLSNTTYKYHVVARNSKGTRYGLDKTFTTSSDPFVPPTDAPAVQTGSASGIGQTSATLSGTVNPNGLSTDYWFEYGIGNFNNSTPSISVGSGTNSLSQSRTVTGLSAGTTYTYHMVARNSKGTHYGLDKTFTTSNGGGGDYTGAPSVNVGSASSIGQYSASLNGSVDPNGLSTEYWCEYGTNNSFQYTSSRASVGSGYGFSSASCPINNLSSNTSYQFRIIAVNGKGTATSGVSSFTTSAYNNGNNGNNGSSGWSPTAITYRAENITQTTVDVFGRVNPNGSYTEYWFEYGVGDSMDRKTSRWHLNPMNSETNVSLMIGNLNPGTNYKFRLMASNGYGTSDGSVISFTTSSNGGSYGTSQLPIATTFAATNVSQNTAIFHSKVNPMGGATSVWFEYGTSSGTLGMRTVAQSVGGEYVYRNFAGVVTGLSSGTTYYFRVGAANNNGTVYGEVMNFRTAVYTYRPSNPVTVIVERSDDPTVTGAEIMLDPSVSRLEPSVGDELDYTLTYRNASKDKISNVAIKVSLPMEVEYLDANVKPSGRSGNNLTFAIGDVTKNSQGIITIKVKIKDDVEGGSSVMFNSFMEYTDAAKKFQTIDSYIGIIVKGGVEDPVNGGFLGSLAAFAGALSGSWIFILLLILILIALIYLIVSRRKDARNS